MPPLAARVTGPRTRAGPGRPSCSCGSSSRRSRCRWAPRRGCGPLKHAAPLEFLSLVAMLAIMWLSTIFVEYGTSYEPPSTGARGNPLEPCNPMHGTPTPLCSLGAFPAREGACCSRGVAGAVTAVGIVILVIDVAVIVIMGAIVFLKSRTSMRKWWDTLERGRRLVASSSKGFAPPDARRDPQDQPRSAAAAAREQSAVVGGVMHAAFLLLEPCTTLCSHLHCKAHYLCSTCSRTECQNDMVFTEGVQCALASKLAACIPRTHTLWEPQYGMHGEQTLACLGHCSPWFDLSKAEC